MDDEKLNAIQDARARAEILKLVRTRHRAQASRMDHVTLWHILRGVGFEVGEYDVITLLQDLEVGGLLEFQTDRGRKRGNVTITAIQLCAKGLAVLEGRIKDDLVLL